MTNNPRFPPEQPRRLVEILTFEEGQLLDVAGPLQVFASCNDLLALSGRPHAYETRVLAKDGGVVTTSSGLPLVVTTLPESGFGPRHADRRRRGRRRPVGRGRRAGRVAAPSCDRRAPGGLGLHRGVPAGRDRPAGRSPCGDPLGLLRAIGRDPASDRGREGPDLRRRRSLLDLGRRHRRDRSGPGDGGSGPRPRDGAGGGAAAGGVPEASRRPGAVQRRPGPAAARPVRRSARMDARPAGGRPHRAGVGRHVRA